tara:strand:+ start:255 stop:1451 length:1197 start_codon:yes stop_codon:yes gene_type:complete
MIFVLLIFLIIILLTLDPKYLGMFKIFALRNLLSKQATSMVQHGLFIAFILWLVYSMFSDEIQSFFQKSIQEGLENEYGKVFTAETEFSWYSYNMAAISRQGDPKWLQNIIKFRNLPENAFSKKDDNKNPLRKELIENWKLKFSIEGKDYFVKPTQLGFSLNEDDSWTYVAFDPNISSDVGKYNQGTYDVEWYMKGGKEEEETPPSKEISLPFFTKAPAPAPAPLPMTKPAPAPSPMDFLMPEPIPMMTPAPAPAPSPMNNALISHAEIEDVDVDKINPPPVYYEPTKTVYGGLGYKPAYAEMLYLNKYPFEPKPSRIPNYNIKGFCEDSGNLTETIDDKCRELPVDVCASTQCCVLVGGEKCVQGDSNGPSDKSIYSDTSIKNKDAYYYQGKCYGNC